MTNRAIDLGGDARADLHEAVARTLQVDERKISPYRVTKVDELVDELGRRGWELLDPQRARDLAKILEEHAAARAFIDRLGVTR